MPRFATALLLAAGASCYTMEAIAAAATAVEYYNRALKHYFITAYPEEAVALDAGTIPGWVRTGGEFTVWTDPAPDLAAVCRFFGTPGLGLNTHFYTADPAECAYVKTLRAWTFEAIAYYAALPVNGTCAGGTQPVYRSFYSDQISDANHRFTVDLTAHVRMTRRGDVLEGVVMCAPVTDQEREADVVRFLEQATLGPTEPLIAEVKAKGIAAWIDEQIPMNVTRYTLWPFVDGDLTPCINDDTPPLTPEKYCALNNLEQNPVAWEFFRQAKTAPDQLRLRMAHVWHQIFVTSGIGRGSRSYAEYQQRLRDGAFGTFENLLAKYALSPLLGDFQNWMRNVPEHNGIKPNENFARELMQLFTIGVNVLDESGTPVTDAAGNRVPSYSQSDVETYARILTGFSYPPRPGMAPDFHGPWYLTGDMIPFQSFHDTGAKSALNGRLTLPAGGEALAEVLAGLHALVEHPNTPSFISRQLIQKTVTSSPTPGYVARVAAVFRDNGSGVLGDLAAVTRAILLDPEARGARKIDPEYGRLREPALLWTAMIRGLDVSTDGVVPRDSATASGQEPFRPGSVFNYYPADFTLAGTNIPAPEFGIYGTAEFLNRVNQIVDLIYNADSYYGPWAAVPNAIGTHSPTLGDYIAYAVDANLLLDRVDRFFMHGTMPPSMRQAIANALGRMPSSDLLPRARLALRLTLTSTDYQVQK